MRKALLLIGLFFLASVLVTVSAKNHAYLPNFERTSESPAMVMSWRLGSEQFTALHKQLDKDFAKWGLSKKMVKNIFYRSHQQLFRQYEQYSMIQDTFSSGSYDCVSGSLILAGLLDYFGFAYEIMETTYHVFLKVAIEDGFIVLEVTDPIEGFIFDKEEQDFYLDKYMTGKDDFVQWTFLVTNEENNSPGIFRSIELQNLIGLQYFNQSIKHFNNNNALLAYQFSISALKMYPAERIQSFSKLLKDNLALAATH